MNALKERMKLPAFMAFVMILVLIVVTVVSADDISNKLDESIDSVAEVMALNAGGSNGTTKLYVQARNGDNNNGCNFQGTTEFLVVSISSSNTNVATVSPSPITFGSCGDTPTLTVTPHNGGSATISVSEISNNTGGTFNLAPATFIVNVAAPANSAPQVAITGVDGGVSYEMGSVPAAVCEVTDTEDGDSSFPATLSPITGDLAAYGLGVQTASCSYTDGGGQAVSASVTYSIVDTTKPVITLLSRTPAANAFGWNNSAVTLTWSCSDEGGSGVVETPVSKILNLEGENQTAAGTCADHAGNTASDTQTGINIDTTAPGMTASVSPAANASGWNNTDVTVSYFCEDDLSGIDQLSAPTIVSAEGKDLTATGSCSDKAGNTSVATLSGINIDKTAPVTTASASPAANGNGWNNTNVTVSYFGEDDLSGIGQCSAQTILSAEGAGQSATGTCADNAGNTSDATASGINIDKTAPAITINGVSNAGQYTLGEVPVASCTAADDLSGIASACAISISGGNANGVGLYTFTAAAADKAGNTATVTGSYSVIYRWDGFLQPINDTAHQIDLATSIFKGGSTVPVKFQLKDAYGKSYQSVTAPIWLTPAKGSSTTAAIDEIAYSLAANAGSQYRWDAAAQQYIYNWSTKGLSSGYYYRIGVTLDDGQTYYVNIGLR